MTASKRICASGARLLVLAQVAQDAAKDYRLRHRAAERECPEVTKRLLEAELGEKRAVEGADGV